MQLSLRLLSRLLQDRPRASVASIPTTRVPNEHIVELLHRHAAEQCVVLPHCIDEPMDSNRCAVARRRALIDAVWSIHSLGDSKAKLVAQQPQQQLYKTNTLLSVFFPFLHTQRHKRNIRLPAVFSVKTRVVVVIRTGRLLSSPPVVRVLVTYARGPENADTCLVA